MDDEPEVGSLADELRLLLAAMAERTDGGADELVEQLRDRLASAGGQGAATPGDEPDVERIDLA